MFTRIDHVMICVPDLKRGIEQYRKLGFNIHEGADKLATYRFNTITAEHHFCSVCGIYTHHKRRSNPNELGINVACLEGVCRRSISRKWWFTTGAATRPTMSSIGPMSPGCFATSPLLAAEPNRADVAQGGAAFPPVALPP